jgi:predicted aldo/keto reductase-like oxidoreductase
MKIRFAGFSTHTSVPLRIALLNNAAKGDWVDAIMVGTDPQLVKTNARFNKALDACHKAGIGLISMKEMRGVQHAPKFLPEFEEMGLNKHEAVLHAVWTDERFSSICSAMPSLKIIKENAAAAKKFKPLDKKKVEAVIDLYKRYASVFCNGCDGTCSRAAGTKAALGDIARCLSYYEMDGDLQAARRAFANLTHEQRNWHGADLEAASRACCNSLDFASILPRAEAHLA